MTFPFVKRDALSLRFSCFLPAPSLSGGGERDRTDDLLRAKQVLSQLSYTPLKLTIDDCLLPIEIRFFYLFNP